MENREPVRNIEPSRGYAPICFGELWELRELLFFLVWRDVKVRYKQTVLGAAWAIIQPFFTMVVFSLFFGRLAKMPSDGIPYPLFSFAALVPWTFFANGMTLSSNSLVGSAHLITKVYFPRIMLPISTIVACGVDFALAFVVLIGMMLYYGISPGFGLIWLVPFSLIAFFAALGAGLWLSAMNVRYRDVRYVLPFLAQIWLFATPVAYPGSLLPEPWKTVFGLNPMAGVVEGFRWALFRAQAFPASIVSVSALAALALLVGGAVYFRKTERYFADLV